MDAVERLSLGEIAEGSLISLTHVHRYQLAAELCAGLRVLDLCCGSGYGTAILAERAKAVTGVDIDAETITEAQRQVTEPEGMRFERADATELLGRNLSLEHDAIVLFEGLEHVADPERVLAGLRANAELGMRLVVSMPNSKTFGEQNPHHVTEYELETARAAFEGFPDLTFLYQFHAEGSLIQPDGKVELADRTGLGGPSEVEYCNHVIALCNMPAGDGAGRSWARMNLVAHPVHNRYMLDLERANRALARTNAKLARDAFALADSAAAGRLVQRELVGSMESSMSWQVTRPLRRGKAITVTLAGALARLRARLDRLRGRRGAR